MSEREHGGDPSAGCRIGRRLRRRPLARSAGRSVPADRPSSIIGEKEHDDVAKKNRRRGQPAARAGQTAPRRNRRHPPPRDKEHPNSPAGNGGERARRRPIFGLQNRAAPSPKTPYLAAPAAAFPPIARAPSLAKKNTTMSRKRTGDAASRRPEPVELRRAGIGGTPRQGIKNTPTRQPEMAEREHGGDPSAGCGIGRRLRRRPPTSQRRPQRSRRSPELHHWLKRTRRSREKEPATRPAGGPSRSNCAAPKSAAPPAKG